MTQPSPRSYHDLTRKEARALVDAYAAGIGDRAAATVAEVRLRAGPADALDFSQSSLVPLWTWFLAEFRLPAEPVSDHAMRASQPPWWYEFHEPLGQMLGPDIAGVVTDIAGYVLKAALAVLPGSEIVLGGGGKRSGDFQKPLLRVPRYGDIELDVGLVIMTIRAFRHEFGMDAPETLKAMVQSWDIPTGQDDSPESSPPTFEVTAIDDRRFSHRVSIDEVVAFDEDARIEETVRRLSALNNIAEVVHEDRELLLIRAPGMATKELEQLLETTWASTHA